MQSQEYAVLNEVSVGTACNSKKNLQWSLMVSETDGPDSAISISAVSVSAVSAADGTVVDLGQAAAQADSVAAAVAVAVAEAVAAEKEELGDDLCMTDRRFRNRSKSKQGFNVR